MAIHAVSTFACAKSSREGLEEAVDHFHDILLSLFAIFFLFAFYLMRVFRRFCVSLVDPIVGRVSVVSCVGELAGYHLKPDRGGTRDKAGALS
ncbi:hypothetical protein PT277_03090 [Acetobacteraceae bacterium ESL0709]|nr:hypothetical protein [Acetobacteraceae bacterium ESL0697]MDF7677687.1 hypothetical protein [Acetobacteraceae bacterium ESL0709]